MVAYLRPQSKWVESTEEEEPPEPIVPSNEFQAQQA